MTKKLEKVGTRYRVVQDDESEFTEAVQQAVDWLQVRPERDALDAAAVVACQKNWGVNIATSRWPEYLTAVRSAVASR